MAQGQARKFLLLQLCVAVLAKAKAGTQRIIEKPAIYDFKGFPKLGILSFLYVYPYPTESAPFHHRL